MQEVVEEVPACVRRQPVEDRTDSPLQVAHVRHLVAGRGSARHSLARPDFQRRSVRYKAIEVLLLRGHLVLDFRDVHCHVREPCPQRQRLLWPIEIDSIRRAKGRRIAVRPGGNEAARYKVKAGHQSFLTARTVGFRSSRFRVATLSIS